jgi:hypothetical protein
MTDYAHMRLFLGLLAQMQTEYFRKSALGKSKTQKMFVSEDLDFLEKELVGIIF